MKIQVQISWVGQSTRLDSTYPILRELERQAATEEDLCFQEGRAHSSEGDLITYAMKLTSIRIFLGRTMCTFFRGDLVGCYRSSVFVSTRIESYLLWSGAMRRRGERGSNHPGLPARRGGEDPTSIRLPPLIAFLAKFFSQFDFHLEGLHPGVHD